MIITKEWLFVAFLVGLFGGWALNAYSHADLYRKDIRLDASSLVNSVAIGDGAFAEKNGIAIGNKVYAPSGWVVIRLGEYMGGGEDDELIRVDRLTGECVYGLKPKLP